MPKIQPTPDAQLSLVLDTNALRGKDVLKRTTIEKALTEARRLGIKFNLYIPRVSFAEWAFQTTHRIQTVAEETRLKLATLQPYTTTHGLSHQRAIGIGVMRHLYKWCSDRQAIIAATPLTAINWKRLISDSINRTPPFSPYQPHAEEPSEKGFRDSLILETVSYLYTSEPSKALHFITGDNLLREAIRQRLSNADNFHAHRGIDEFLSLFRVAEKENVALPPTPAANDTYAWLRDNVAINAYVDQAALHFYQPELQQGVYYTQNVEALIKKQLALAPKFFEPPHLSYWRLNQVPPPYGLEFSYHDFLSQFGVPTSGTFKVGETHFLNESDDGLSHWSTTIDYVLEEPTNFDATYALPRTRVLVYRFDVVWTCRITPEQKFLDDLIEGIQPSEATFPEITFTPGLSNDNIPDYYGIFRK